MLQAELNSEPSRPLPHGVAPSAPGVQVSFTNSRRVHLCLSMLCVKKAATKLYIVQVIGSRTTLIRETHVPGNVANAWMARVKVACVFKPLILSKEACIQES